MKAHAVLAAIVLTFALSGAPGSGVGGQEQTAKPAASATEPRPQQGTDVGTLDKESAERVFPNKPPYSRYAARTFPTRPFFGDTHLPNDEFADNELWDKGNLDASVAKEMLEFNQGNEEGNQR